jgi:hypothetical protein
MKKSKKSLLFERMNKIGGMPLNENFYESEPEKEGSMYIQDLDGISKNAEEFKHMINTDEDLPAWVQDKITIANHNMEAITGWKKSQGHDDNINEDQYAEKAGTGQGIITNLISGIEEALIYLDEMLQNSPELETDVNNIKKRLTLGLDRAKNFVGEGKEHKKKGNIRGLWGYDDDNDGFVDGSADGGFGGDGGGGE